MTARRRFLAPEVVGTSSMDCGPASLKCLLEGFGIRVSYGRLREACQTDVDGTSIDTIEQSAVQLGLNAEQIMIPAEHIIMDESAVLPALVVVRLPSGETHFVVAWRRHGNFLQVMDPAAGRRWQTCRSFLNEVYVHTTAIAAGAWREWAGSPDFLDPLRRRITDLGISDTVTSHLVDAALASQGWRPLAALDAAARTVASIGRSCGLQRGPQTARILERLLERDALIPSEKWLVQSAPSGPDGEEQLWLRGAVIVHVRGRLERRQQSAAALPLSPELAAAIEQRQARAGRELLSLLLGTDGLLAPAAILSALLIASGGTVLEAILFRGFFDLGDELAPGQHLGVMAGLLAFAMGLLLLELPLSRSLSQWGRRLEVRLRVAFLQKIPRLGDRYFQSRLASDMAERSHNIHRIRQLPMLAGQLTRRLFELILTTAGIIWLDPNGAPFAALAALLALALPLIAQPLLMERDLRVRTHGGALARFYLDALLGIVAVRAHGAERVLRREHERVLAQWSHSSFALQRAAVWLQGLQLLAGFGLASALLFDRLARGGETGPALLLIYWALNLPALGEEVAQLAWQYPEYRNLTLRLLEPLGALEESAPLENQRHNAKGETRTGGMAVELERVTVRIADHTILDDIDVAIPQGSHVAIVGPSGAGKSSMVGLLLGWHRPAAGRILIDGLPLDGTRLEQLRQETAWVDPTVQLWNRSLFENLLYGAPEDRVSDIGMALDAADLRDLLEHFPDGLQTTLGEGGALVSGGEGQRVRLGRAVLRGGTRLVLLDEAFRGLDRERRRKLLTQARKLWADATLLCVTHDIGETKAFDRVLVIEHGKIVEDGVPNELAVRTNSRYRSMLEAEAAVRHNLWSAGDWRRFRLDEGKLIERCDKGDAHEYHVERSGLAQ